MREGGVSSVLRAGKFAWLGAVRLLGEVKEK
jgi:hypothetical protein